MFYRVVAPPYIGVTPLPQGTGPVAYRGKLDGKRHANKTAVVILLARHPIESFYRSLRSL